MGERSAVTAPGTGLPGLVVAGITAVVSGASVFVNSYGVHHVASPSVYTTAKNLTATVVLSGIVGAGLLLRRLRPASPGARFVAGPRTPGVRPPTAVVTVVRLAALAYVGIVGGGLAFVLFFDGLAETSATPAAFWRDTLVVWVAVLALPVLHEHLHWWNLAAIALLVTGQVALTGGVGHLAATHGELLVLASSLLWAVEVVLLKVVLRDLSPGAVSLVRMGVGSVTLLCVLAVAGTLHRLASLDAGQLGWVVLTGLLLAAYVATWTTALARARAVDVTSVLVGSAVVTALLQAAAGATTLATDALGLVLIALGAGAVLWTGLRRAGSRPAEVVAR